MGNKAGETSESHHLEAAYSALRASPTYTPIPSRTSQTKGPSNLVKCILLAFLCSFRYWYFPRSYLFNVWKIRARLVAYEEPIVRRTYYIVKCKKYLPCHAIMPIAQLKNLRPSKEN